MTLCHQLASWFIGQFASLLEIEEGHNSGICSVTCMRTVDSEITCMYACTQNWEAYVSTCRLVLFMAYYCIRNEMVGFNFYYRRQSHASLVVTHLGGFPNGTLQIKKSLGNINKDEESV
jgi:hypothetical protein